MRAAIYARYSSEQQREASIEDQLRACRARATREGWHVVAHFSDAAISGATMLRPGLHDLLAQLQRGTFDVVLTESLDRLSRDQEHIARLHKQAQFSGVRIVTLAEGEVSELHVGLKGTMGALYLKDLADKTRRGLEGRVRQGRSGGGLCYGYRVVHGPTGRDGNPERGLREIDPVQSVVVRRVFEAFAAGEGPISIAKRLNAEGIPGPRGGAWSDGALRGHARAGTGLLRNELYAGRLVWNRRRWLKDPATGRRVARQNSDDARVVEDVAELRIIEPALWERVQQRLAAAARPQGRRLSTGNEALDHLWYYRRAPTLLSGKVLCASCGRSFITTGKDYMACKAMAKLATCSNRVRVRRSKLEAQVLEALGRDLMTPEAVGVFVAEFTAEWNRLQAGVSSELEDKQRECEAVSKKLDGLIEAIADGLRAPGLQTRLDELGARKSQLEAEAADLASRSTAPRLHPNLSAVYRQEVQRLQHAIAGESNREVLEAARALIERVEIGPPLTLGGEPRIELVGHLTGILRAAGLESLPERQHAKGPPTRAGGPVDNAFVCSESVDAGTGFEPVTFRL